MDIDNDLQYLAQTDEQYAELSASTKRLEDTMKHAKGSFISESKSSVSKAENEYYASAEYLEAIDLLKKSNVMVNTLRNKRATAILRIDVWRTLEASRRKGTIQ